ncbi:hypothetical protein Sden_2653 [Shewanella denitrificans OS217]|uniref:Glycosyl transferase family 1 domain-containing protein n=2 Tax=Shewanella TaxID=22 RepID=Q12KU4_SHEDO|nr:hypothetical protein Sden_2653 [Shewanella denitrificans OS217]
MNCNKTLVFYFPYREVGGVSVLFLRLATILSKSFKVILMDFDNGYMARNLPDNVKFVPFDQPELLPVNSVLILQSIPLWRIHKVSSFPRDIDVFFWNLHPDNLFPGLVSNHPSKTLFKFIAPLVNSFSFLRKRKIKNMLKVLLHKQSIAFMDLENKNKTYRYFNVPLDTYPLLPIMTGYENKTVINFAPIDDIKCLWLGRLEGFKVPILLHTIDRLDGLSRKISLTIVGDGVSTSKIKEHASLCKHLNCNFVGTVPFDGLDSLIASHHIVFSMGTSALEGAKNKIPTFCLDYSYQEIQGLYKYKYLFDVKGFNVGEEITSEHLEDVSSLDVEIEKLVNDFSAVSKNSYEYWKQHHSPNVITDKFLAHLRESSCTLHELIVLGYSDEDFFTKLITKLHHPIENESGFISR